MMISSGFVVLFAILAITLCLNVTVAVISSNDMISSPKAQTVVLDTVTTVNALITVVAILTVILILNPNP